MARLNWSTLRHIAVSPKLLAYRVEHPQAETPALRLGRAIHCAILEPEKYAKTWLVPNICNVPLKSSGGMCRNPGTKLHQGYWYCGTHIKQYVEPGDECPIPEGIEPMTSDDAEIVRLCAESVRAHKVAAKILSGGAAEQGIEWTDEETGIECRGRLDYLTPGAVVDLKTTRRETVREFERDVAAHLYHGQVAWYHAGAIRAGRIPQDAALPYIVSASTAEPYDVAVYQLSRASFEAGRILARDLLTRYDRCVKSGMWPGIAPDLVTMELPDWSPGMMGSEESEAW